MNHAAGKTESSVTTVNITVNGKTVSSTADPMQRASDFLRARGYPATKTGCDAGDCGACTVLINGEAACACLVPVAQLDGCAVETAESDSSVLNVLREAFLTTGAAQCGICTPGMLMASVALLQRGKPVGKSEVEDALGGVLCRCTGYSKIVDAVLLAAVQQGLASADATESCSGGSVNVAIDSIAASSAVGSRVTRLDGRAKVDGTEQFAADVIPADALYLKMIRSPYHCADFTLQDTGAWVAETPGIELVISCEDVAGINGFGVIPGFTDQPVFAQGRANFRGEAVAAVIGEKHAIDAFDPAGFPLTWHEQGMMRSVKTGCDSGISLKPASGLSVVNNA